jgi:hypothetical protein
MRPACAWPSCPQTVGALLPGGALLWLMPLCQSDAADPAAATGATDAGHARQCTE